MNHRFGDRGDEIAVLQRRLVHAGYKVDITHVFDEATEQAVMELQRKSNLVVDGICGPKTFIALRGSEQPKHLAAADLEKAAETLGVSLAAIRAVNEVESRGQGFLLDGRAAILFERHVFWQRLEAHGIDPEGLPPAKVSPAILSKTPGGYQGGVAEYIRMEAARHIHLEAAYESASWGAFQIMGYHWKALGYPSIFDFVMYMQRSEAEHLEAFVRFIAKDSTLLAALKAKKWAQFAKAYNGPAYARNLYDAKLAAAYAKYSGLDKAAA